MSEIKKVKKTSNTTAEDAKSIINSLVSISSRMTEISDGDLQSSDTENMIKHGELYTKLLSIYVDDIKLTLDKKRYLKEEFYYTCERILNFTCAVFFIVIALMLIGIVPVTHVSVLIGTVVSFLTVFIVVPHTITKYLFNTEEEKYMTDIIKSVQAHDVEIRKGMK